MTRELSYLLPMHPEFLFDGALMLVDHPTVRPLAQGEPTLGWEGDSRLAIYLHLKDQRFALLRLEADGEYRGVAALPRGAEITPASINKLIARLVSIDSRRGFDPMADVDKANAIVEKHRQTDYEAQLEDVADALLFGLANSHLKGVDLTRPRQVLPKR